MAVGLTDRLRQRGGTVGQGQGQGQALIYPIYSVESGNDTAIHITNSSDSPSIAKVRFLEGMDGRVVHSLNLYLKGRDTWTGVLTRSEAGTRLVSRDASCTLPPLPAEGVELGVGDPELAARSRVGTLEVIEMGTPAPQGPVRPLYEAKDCTAFRDAFADGGVWAQDSRAGLAVPSGRLFGSATLTNVMNGHQINLDATALQSFSMGARQTRPEDPEPSLAQSETAYATMRGTTVAFRNGAEAVTALLTHRSLGGEFAYGAGLNAETDWVITFPTKAYLNADPEAERYSPFMPRYRAPGRVCEYMESWPIDRDGQASYEPLKTNLCAITNIMGVGESDILGGRYVRANVPAPEADTGWMSLNLENFEDQILSPPYQYRQLAPLAPLPPFNLTGLGLIGFSIIRIENGDVGGLLSNYVSVKRLTGPTD